MQIEFDATVLGGFPVTVQALFYGDAFEELIILTRKGKRARWIEARLTRNENERLAERAYSELDNHC
jgi:hypothetical protein